MAVEEGLTSNGSTLEVLAGVQAIAFLGCCIFYFVANLLMLVPALLFMPMFMTRLCRAQQLAYLKRFWHWWRCFCKLFVLKGVMEYVRAAVLSSVATRMDKVQIPNI